MKRTLFVLGRTPDLAFLELSALFPTVSRLRPDVAALDEEVDGVSLMHRLGGTVKIVQVMREAEEVSVEMLVDLLAAYAQDQKLAFGVYPVGAVRLSPKLFHEVKEALVGRGIHTRYVEAKHEGGLTSVVISKQEVTEVVIVPFEGKYLFGITTAVQEFEQWNQRDWQRPAPDAKHGMLPPKVARMLVNIALAGASLDHPMLFDPFCGVGTILQEGLLTGANCTGSDVSAEAIARAKKNLDWLRTHNPEIDKLYNNVFVADATHVASHLAPNSIDAIATEPFMGEPVDTEKRSELTPERVKNILRGLEKLYIGSLKEWTKILKTGSRVVMAMPAYVTPRAVMRVKNVVDRCESLGYTLLTGPIEYSRPQAVVRREFYIFQKK